MGIYNYSASGVFLTPFFLNYFIFSGVGLWLFVKHLKSGHQLLYGIYALGILGVSATHPMTLQSFSTYFKLPYTAPHAIWQLVGLLLFFGTLMIIEIKRIRIQPKSWSNWLPFLLLLTSIITTFLNLGYWQILFISVYIISYQISLKQTNYQNEKGLQGVGYQLLLFFVLENTRFFSTL